VKKYKLLREVDLLLLYMFLTKIPTFLHILYPDYIWRYKTYTKEIYLTFDDGPTPGITDWVLKLLAQYDAKATFFMVGDNVKRYPEIAHSVIDQGHEVGNHSQTHKNGWKTDNIVYLRDVILGHQTLVEYTGLDTVLFRPPYAKITSTQARPILRTHEIVMMDVISGDFNTSLDGEVCAQNVLKHALEGSIVVFHDSQKAWNRLKVALPIILEYYAQAGFEFKAVVPSREFSYEMNAPIA